MLNMKPYATDQGDSPSQYSIAGDRQLDNALTSGEIAAIFLGGTLPENKVATLNDITTGSDIARIDRQLSLRRDSIGVDIDGLLTPGFYKVDTNLPSGGTVGDLTVYDVDGTTEIYQILVSDKGTFTRTHSAVWTPWAITDIEGTINSAIARLSKENNYDTSKLGVDIDTIKSTGYYEVNSNLPFGITLGELRVGYDTENPTRIIQELKDTSEAESYRRQFNGSDWSIWQMTPETDFNYMVIDELSRKASRDYVNQSIVNTYTGTEDPNTLVPAIGKSGDRYHRFTQSTPTSLKVGTSEEDYKDGFFDLFFSYDGTGVIGISIDSSRRTVYVSFLNNPDHTDQMVLNIKGTDVPLQVVNNQPSTFEGTYDAAFDSTIQGIKIGDAYDLKGGVLTGKDEDYTKFNDTWFYTPVIDQTYDWATGGINDTGNPIVITANTFQPVVSLTTPARAQGVYQLTFTATWKYTSVTSSAIFRWTLDNGVTWKEIWTEPKDTTNNNIFSYSFPKEFQGPFDFKMEARCETTGQTLTIDFAHIVIERKK